MAVLLGLGGLFLFLEVFSVFWFLLRPGSFEYALQAFEAQSSAAHQQMMGNDYLMDVEGTKCRWVEIMRPHPYLGYVKRNHPPCNEPGINQMGFKGPEFPESRPKEEFAVLVLGGSVAENLVTLPLMNEPTFEEKLNSGWEMPGFQRVRLFNGAIAGWKQPQPLHLLTEVAPRFHAVVVLDGYNELPFLKVGMRLRIGAFPPEIGAAIFDRAESYWAGLAARWEGALLRLQLWLGPVGRTRSAMLAFSSSRGFLRGEVVRGAFAEGGLARNFLYPEQLSNEEIGAKNLEDFLRYHRLIHEVAALQGLKELHLLQPVPGIHRELSEEERKVVGDLAYRDRYLQIEASFLRGVGFSGASLTDVFSGVKEDVYVDPIHFNEVGTRLVQKRIFREMEKRWGLRPKKGLLPR